MKENIKLSVLDTEKKYEIEYEEQSYGVDSIVSYGKDNNMPILFKNCYRNSATLKSIIDGMVNYVLGDEVVVNDSAAAFREKVNRSGMTMRQFIANLTLSYCIYGGFAVQVIYSKFGTVCELYPLDFSRCRTNESGTKVFYSKKNWTKYGTKAEMFDRFDPKSFNVDKPTQIFYFKGDFTTNVYPLPLYFAAVKDILTEIECANYSLNSVSNGFSARYVLNMPDVGNLTDKQKEGIEDAIKNKFCNSDNNTTFLIYWTDSENEKLEISKIETDDANDKYISIKDNARSNIYTALRCTPNLMGLPTETTGFSSQEYSDAFKLYQKTVINPIQDILLEAINKITGTKDSITITPFLIQFDND